MRKGRGSGEGRKREREEGWEKGEEGGRGAKKREGGGMWFTVVQAWFKCGSLPRVSGEEVSKLYPLRNWDISTRKHGLFCDNTHYHCNNASVFSVVQMEFARTYSATIKTLSYMKLQLGENSPIFKPVT